MPDTQRFAAAESANLWSEITNSAPTGIAAKRSSLVLARSADVGRLLEMEKARGNCPALTVLLAGGRQLCVVRSGDSTIILQECGNIQNLLIG
jgi:hypothetical protein